MSWTELFAAGPGAVNVRPAIRRGIRNSPIGIAMAALYGIVYFHARHYPDAILQMISA
jgi:nicotinamide riboside transporter PnuC